MKFAGAPGPITLARFCRKAGRYWLAVGYGEVINGREDLIVRSTSCWPHDRQDRHELGEFYHQLRFQSYSRSYGRLSEGTNRILPYFRNRIPDLRLVETLKPLTSLEGKTPKFKK